MGKTCGRKQVDSSQINFWKADESDSMNDEMNMRVSSVCEKDGKRFAFVTFSDSERMAEGRIPECVIISNNGFSLEEVKMLEMYMKNDLSHLKRLAAGVRWIDAFMD